MDLSLLDLAAVFLSLSAVGWLNLKLFDLPMGVVMLVVGIVAALALSSFDLLAPAWVSIASSARLSTRSTFPTPC